MLLVDHHVRILIVIPTYEPTYTYLPELEEFYTKNFDSFYNAEADVDLKLVITDFASSKSFKGFLTRYIAGRSNSYFIDGGQEASIHVAINIALRQFDFDYVLYAASDMRARDHQWLRLLLRDFNDPKVHIVVPTVTATGNGRCEQTQPGPIERDSRIIRFPERFHLLAAIFSKRFFEAFDHRYPDIYDGDYSECSLGYSLAALGSLAKINFRVNIVHDRFMQARPRPDLPSGWRQRNRQFEADTQRYETRRRILPYPNFFTSRKGNNLKRAIFHIQSLKTQGWWYMYLRWFAKRGFDNFCRLDVPTRVAVVKALFYRPESDYERYTYTVRSSAYEHVESSLTAPSILD